MTWVLLFAIVSSGDSFSPMLFTLLFMSSGCSSILFLVSISTIVHAASLTNKCGALLLFVLCPTLVLILASIFSRGWNLQLKVNARQADNLWWKRDPAEARESEKDYFHGDRLGDLQVSFSVDLHLSTSDKLRPQDPRGRVSVKTLDSVILTPGLVSDQRRGRKNSKLYVLWSTSCVI